MSACVSCFFRARRPPWGAMRNRICRISFGRPWRFHPMSMDTLGFEPRAFRIRGGSDNTTPRAPGKITALHVHRATTAGEVSWLWAQQEKSGPPVVQDDKTLLAVFGKGLRDRNIPICTLSQNGWVTDRSRHGSSPAVCPLIRSQLYMCTGRAGEVVTGRAGEALVISDAR